MEFISSEKGKRKLALNGFMYVRNKTKNGVTYWRCEDYLKCKSRVSTAEDDSLMRTPSEHSHPPNPARVIVARAKASMRDRAVKSDERTSNIIQSETQDISLTTAGALPKKTSLQRMIQRKRVCPEGNGLMDELRVTPRGEAFVLEEDDQNEFYMFASQKNLDILNNCANWFCDGTFDVAPLGYQLYTIHALVNENRTVPLVYTLTENKSEAVHNRILCLLEQQRPGIAPETVTIDFEMAAYNAISSSFPRAEILGCLFHFGQCSFRKIQALSLQRWFTEDAEHALRIKCFQALAFVPPEDVVQRFEDFLATFSDDDEQHLSEYIDYFETTWIGRLGRRNRRQPLFPIRCWNVFHRVQDDLPRTNNSIEGWHNAFSKRVSISHPTLRRLVKKIKQEQGSNEIFIEKLNAGIAGPPRKKRYDAVNQRLKSIVENYDSTNININSYLRAIAHNL
ncbi:unnamed protein product [Clavelina lepadiformis]|uniref:MULE transposase domain-containing protein n=1 Tax=Clavelina lepadiformis TaxID=159417 RepID=A0ABP0H1B3_CLALP